MSEIIHVQHPVPVRKVPRGSTRDQLVFAQATTPARLREIDGTDMVFVGSLHPAVGHKVRPEELYAFEGRLWSPVFGEGKSMGLSRRELAGYLSGEVEEWRYSGTDVLKAFARSPLLALKSPSWTRGEANAVRDPKQVVYDGTDRARAALVDYVENRLVISGGEAFVQVTGPVAIRRHDSEAVLFQASAFPNIGAEIGYFCRPDRMDELVAYHVREDWSWAGSPDTPPILQGLPKIDPALFWDADLWLYANLAPREMISAVGNVITAADAPPGTEAPEELQAMLRGLQPYADLGRVGAVHMDEVETVAGKVIAAGDLALEAYAGSRVYAGRTVERIARIAREIVLPRVRVEEALAPDDADVLSDLGPGIVP